MKRNCKQLLNKLKASLRTRLYKNNPEQSVYILNPNKNIFDRTLLFSSSGPDGSMCVEASFAVSFFLFFFINILSVLLLFMSYLGEMNHLQQRGKKTAAAAYSEERKEVFSDELLLKKDISYRALLPVIDYNNGKLETICVVKPWTGYIHTSGFSEVKREESVYVTEYGEVYHTKRSCTHLSLSIKTTLFEKINKERYEPCELCVNKEQMWKGKMIYITDWGERYHMSVSCSGLKRTVYSIAKSETGGMRECLSCGR